MENGSCIREGEELTLGSWPALTRIHHDGWVLAISEGHTRRANSVYPLYAGALPPASKVSYCEKEYERAGLRPRFKLTEASIPSDLATSLRGRGYREEGGRASVQFADLTAARPEAAPEARETARDLERWVRCYQAVTGCSNETGAGLGAILGRVRLPTTRMVIESEGRCAAVGVATVQHRTVQLYSIHVAEGMRRRGLGRKLTTSLLAWGRASGARRAMLQVVLGNEPALALYASLGFREGYQYWYLGIPEKGGG